jgi:hypothetical protein
VTKSRAVGSLAFLRQPHTRKRLQTNRLYREQEISPTKFTKIAKKKNLFVFFGIFSITWGELRTVPKV